MFHYRHTDGQYIGAKLHQVSSMQFLMHKLIQNLPEELQQRLLTEVESEWRNSDTAAAQRLEALAGECQNKELIDGVFESLVTPGSLYDSYMTNKLPLNIERELVSKLSKAYE